MIIVISCAFANFQNLNIIIGFVQNKISHIISKMLFYSTEKNIINA